MNTNTINSLITLFSISVNKCEDSQIEDVKDIFHEFLIETVEFQYISGFMIKFEESLDNYSSFKSGKKVSLNSVRLIRICEETAANLSVRDRFQVLYYLLLLITRIDYNVYSMDFVKLVSDCYGFEEDIFKLISDFITGKGCTKVTELNYEDLHIADFIDSGFGFILLKPLVENKFTLDNQTLNGKKVLLLGKNNVLAYDNKKKYFYQELLINKRQEFPANDFSLIIKDVEVKRKNKIILHKTSLKIESGNLIGILGKSGSGKTTFLKAVSGIDDNYSGQIDFIFRYESTSNFSKAFVSQSNSFIPMFNVKEHIFQRMDFLQVPQKSKKELLEEVAGSVGLVEDLHKIVVKTDGTSFQLSGGQKKRLAIAMELIADPDILLLDEPTSGLASNDSLKIITLLKKIALRNKIVIASIHQPDYETLMIFDKILIIDEYGYPVYYGTPVSAAEYFRKYTGRIDKNSLMESYFNPSLLLDIIEEKEYDEKGDKKNIRKITPEEWYYKFIESDKENFYYHSNKEKLKKKKKRQYNFLKSFIYQFKLSIMTDIKNRPRILLILIIPLFVGIVFSMIAKYPDSQNYSYYFNPNIPVWLLIIFISSVFIGLVCSGHEFIFLRHFHNTENIIVNKNMSLLTSRICKYLIISFIQTVLLVVPAVFILELDFHLYPVSFLTMTLIFWGNMAGLILSKIFSTTTFVYLIIPLVIIPQMIFSGALIPFDSFNKNFRREDTTPVFSGFVPVRWASESVITCFFLDNPYEKNFYRQKYCFYESVYYLDFIIPEIKRIYNYDSIYAKELLNNEFCWQFDHFNAVQFKSPDILERIEDYFILQKNNSMDSIDLIQATLKNSEELILKYTNRSVNKIVNNQNIKSPFSVHNGKFVRKYHPVYNISSSFRENNIFMIGVKKLGERYISTYLYNFLILVFYNILLITVLIILTKFKK